MLFKEAIVAEFNKNHDKLGHFASKGGSSGSYLGMKVVANGNAYGIKGTKPVYNVKSDNYFVVDDIEPSKTFHSGDEPAIPDTAIKKNISRLSDSEKQAITGYTSGYGYGSYGEVNKHLRGESTRDPKTKASADAITSGLSKSKLGADTYVYRGSGVEMFSDPKVQGAIKAANSMVDKGILKRDPKVLAPLEKLKGAVISDKAPLSTSTAGSQFLTNADVKITIKTKASDKAMQINSLSKYSKPNDNLAFLGTKILETEVLYAPGTSFEITDVKVTAKGVNILMETTDKSATDIVKEMFERVIIAEFNKNHDKLGRFASSGGSGKVLDMGQQSPKKIDAYMQKHYDDKDKISFHDKRSLNDYVLNTSLISNKDLRASSAKAAKDKVKDIRNNDPDAFNDMYLLDNATHLSKLVEPTMLYRGIYSGESFKLKVGSKIVDYGYGSTSMSEEVAKKFADFDLNDPTKKRYIMKITAPKGTPGVAASVVAPYHAAIGNVEAEWLLPRGSATTITKIVDKVNYIEVQGELSFSKVEKSW